MSSRGTVMRAAVVAAAVLLTLLAVFVARGPLHRLTGLGSARSVNVLFLGADSGRLEGNTDTIVLARIDPSARRVVALWIPRDTQVEIPGRGRGKINAANPAGGPELAVATVENLVDARIDYFVLTDFKAAARVIDHLGGVEVDVPARMDYDDPAQDLHIHLAKGRQRLNGAQALGFARFRHEALGDIARTQHQQALVAALMDQVLSPAGLVRLPGAVRLALESSRTNAGLSDLAGLLVAARGGEWTILTETLPGTFLNLKGISYWGVDTERAQAAWADLLAGQTRPTVEEGPRPRGGTVPAAASGPGEGAAGGEGSAPPPDGGAAEPPGDAAPPGDAGTEGPPAGDPGAQAGDAPAGNGAETGGEPAAGAETGGDTAAGGPGEPADPPPTEPDGTAPAQVDAPSAPQP